MSQLNSFHENLTDHATKAKNATDLETVDRIKREITTLIDEASRLIERAEKTPHAMLEYNIQRYKELYDSERATTQALKERIKALEGEKRQVTRALTVEKEKQSIAPKKQRPVSRSSKPIGGDKKSKNPHQHKKKGAQPKTKIRVWRNY